MLRGRVVLECAIRRGMEGLWRTKLVTAHHHVHGPRALSIRTMMGFPSMYVQSSIIVNLLSWTKLQSLSPPIRRLPINARQALAYPERCCHCHIHLEIRGRNMHT
jgi:hypothetical protein